MSAACIMGVINLTPDSFYDGAKYNTVEAALARARQLQKDGAEIIDLGGESSRPGAEPIGLGEELARVLPALHALQAISVPLSIDTYRAETARRALAGGAAMVNDISAGRGDPGMAAVVAEAGCPYVIMHMQGAPKNMQNQPKYGNVIDDICAFFEERITALTHQGVRETQIWVDPGFGFGKTVAHNLAILKHLSAFKRFGRPLLIGASNKSTLGEVLDLPADDRTEATAATTAIALWNGADCIRVHDVKYMARIARMTRAIMDAKA